MKKYCTYILAGMLYFAPVTHSVAVEPDWETLIKLIETGQINSIPLQTIEYSPGEFLYGMTIRNAWKKGAESIGHQEIKLQVETAFDILVAYIFVLREEKSPIDIDDPAMRLIDEIIGTLFNAIFRIIDKKSFREVEKYAWHKQLDIARAWLATADINKNQKTEIQLRIDAQKAIMDSNNREIMAFSPLTEIFDENNPSDAIKQFMDFVHFIVMQDHNQIHITRNILKIKKLITLERERTKKLLGFLYDTPIEEREKIEQINRTIYLTHLIQVLSEKRRELSAENKTLLSDMNTWEVEHKTHISTGVWLKTDHAKKQIISVIEEEVYNKWMELWGIYTTADFYSPDKNTKKDTNKQSDQNGGSTNGCAKALL